MKYVVIFTLLLFTGCAHQIKNLKVSLGVISPYEAAVDALKQGQVMEARKRIVTMKKDDDDYEKSQQLLEKKVDPARLKLLRYYARKGKDEQNQGHWAAAEEAFHTAAGLSIQPKALLKYEREMHFKARQLRLETLYKQVITEDSAWLAWLNAYYAPTGLVGDDIAMAQSSEAMRKVVEERATLYWELAKRFEKDNLPELAWVYAESYLRFKPDVRSAQELRQKMLDKTPVELNLQVTLNTQDTAKTSPTETAAAKVVKQRDSHDATEASVKALMDAGKWLEAKREAQRLRAQGDDQGDKLLQSINDKLEGLAAKAYQDGNLAFRLEKIDSAVSFWALAVKFAPKEQLYIESLRRGRQIQERLAALRVEEDPAADKKVEE